MVLRPSESDNEDFYNHKMVSFYWIEALQTWPCIEPERLSHGPLSAGYKDCQNDSVSSDKVISAMPILNQLGIYD